MGIEASKSKFRINRKGQIIAGVEEFARYYNGSMPGFIDIHGNFSRAFEVVK